VRLVNVSGTGATGRVSLGALWLDPAGDAATLRLAFDGMIAPVAPVRITPGAVFRIGVRQRRGSGADGIVEGYVAAGDGPFGAPFARKANGPWTLAAESVTVGSTAGGAVGLVIDDVRIDSAGMPPASR
jgi:hypothetical protein